MLEKLAFRLRLVGGSVRCATGPVIVPVLPLLLPFLESKYVHHSDKMVRKATSKLWKVSRNSYKIIKIFLQFNSSPLPS